MVPEATNPAVKPLNPYASPDLSGANSLTGLTPLRVWPGVLLALIYWAIVGYVIAFEPKGIEIFFVQLAGGPLLAVLLLVWWVFASRASTRERLSVPAAGIGGLVLTALVSPALLRKQVPIELILYALPAVCTVGVLAALLFRSGGTLRQRLVPIALMLAWCGWMTLRFEGARGNVMPRFAFRWQPSAEDKFIAERQTPPSKAKPLLPGPSPEPAPGDWANFRGPGSQGLAAAPNLATDWKAKPPKEIWSKRVGLGWGSMIVIGDWLYTQEQREQDEAVVAYSATTGEERWEWKHAARYEDPPSGAGPRATPAYGQGKVFAIGGTGVLAALDASTGQLVWKQNLVPANLPPPGLLWGYASSPLLWKNLVICYSADDKSLTAFDMAEGKQVWTAGTPGLGHSSPSLANLGGVEQVLLMTANGIEAFVPATGELLWSFAPLNNQDPAMQPLVLNDHQVLAYGVLLDVKQVEGKWSAQPVWESSNWKLTFNDRVAIGQAAYGFDSSLFACLDLETGKKAWKKGRYGNGQVLGIPAQKLLVVLSEEGELVLLSANPQTLTEQGRVPALQGTTWNHPALVGNRLFVRNGEKMACLELATQESGPQAEK